MYMICTNIIDSFWCNRPAGMASRDQLLAALTLSGSGSNLRMKKSTTMDSMMSVSSEDISVLQQTRIPPSYAHVNTLAAPQPAFMSLRTPSQGLPHQGAMHARQRSNPPFDNPMTQSLAPRLYQKGASSSGNLRLLKSPVSFGEEGSAKFVIEIDEVRVTPMSSRKGFLQFLENSKLGWARKFVSVRRPYLFVYQNETDITERSIINLAHIQLEYSEDRQAMLRVNL